MTTTVRILGSRAREQVPGTSITLLAPGFRGSLAQLTPGVAGNGFDLPFNAAAAGADVMLAAQLTLQLEGRQMPMHGLRSRSALVTYPRVIVPRRHGVAYALLQTDESGISSFLSPLPGDGEAVFALTIAAGGSTRRTLRVLMWPELSAAGPGSLAVASRWERLRRPDQIAQRGIDGGWQPPDWRTLAGGPVLLLMHDTFATPQTAFADWLHDDSFSDVSRRYEGRCLACTQPTLATGIDENLNWLVAQLGSLPGPFDVVAHGRGGLLARALAVDGRMPLRTVCQVGTPNKGTILARESHLPRFLDAHVAMLAHLPASVAQSTLEGALCMARFLAQGLRAALPGVEALTPDSAPLRPKADLNGAGMRWFTIGARFVPPEGHVEQVDDFNASPNDLVVPAEGCHEPGIPVSDSLRLAGIGTHHHNYFANPRVRECLSGWLLS